MTADVIRASGRVVGVALCLSLVAGPVGADGPGSDGGDTRGDAAPPPFVFVDATADAGVDFRGPASREKRYILESVSGGVALLDLDADGALDLFLVDSLTVETAHRPERARSRLYRGDGRGHFEDVTARSGLPRLGWGVGVCAGDADGDGHLDLYVTGAQRNHLLLGRGDLRFEDGSERAGVAGGGWSTGCSFADVDRDGDLDLYVARYLDLDLAALPAFGEGEICRYRGVPVQCGPRGLTGLPDLFFRNEGDGRFVEASRAAGLAGDAARYGLGVSFFDADLDGWPDLYVANDTGANFFYRNRGDGRFEELAHLFGLAVSADGREQGSMGLAIGDYRNDGWPGVFVTHFSEEPNTLYRNRGGEYFTDDSFSAGLATASLPYVGWGTAFLDADHDGRLDLAVVNGHVYPQMDEIDLEASAPYLQRSMLYRNSGDGTFDAVDGGPLDSARASRGLAVGDLDADGRLDLVVTDLDAETRILLNRTVHPPGAGRWLIVELVGLAPHRHAIGAHLRLRVGELEHTREVRSGTSYLSQSDLRQHVGLGTAGRVDRVDVRWPDGSTSSHGPYAADQVVRIEQPSPAGDAERLE